MGDDVEESPTPCIISSSAVSGSSPRVWLLPYSPATEDGAVWTWGWGRGQLGHGEASSTPVRVDALYQAMHQCRGGHHATRALAKTAAPAGEHHGRQQRRRPSAAAAACQAHRSTRRPQRAVAVGGRHALLTTSDGRLLALGSGSHGQLGLGDLSDKEEPEPIDPRTCNRQLRRGAPRRRRRRGCDGSCWRRPLP